jgi:hypothetical protein
MDSELASQSTSIARLAEDVRLANEASSALEMLANQRNEAVQLLVRGAVPIRLRGCAGLCWGGAGGRGKGRGAPLRRRPLG